MLVKHSMQPDEKSVLKIRVLEFLRNHDISVQDHDLKVSDDNGKFFVVYGIDIITGIVGFGSTIEATFNDFEDNFAFYIKRNTASG